MEDLTGLIIYVILAIIGVLASIYRNKNKKKPVITPPIDSETVEAEPAETPESTFDPFAGLFEEQVEEEDMAVEIEETATGQDIEKEESYKNEYQEGAAVSAETNEILISDNESGIISDEISDNEYSNSITETEKYESVIGEEEEYTEKKEEFDLRKAVIYSEILKRREY
ncbi:MAG: hypothetical protein JSV22_11220 [Bacteroidales bacterium]|nr:MAG: hypothetical protein JSV22_11220 [Bacteroidales bacterium]